MLTDTDLRSTIIKVEFSTTKIAYHKSVPLLQYFIVINILLKLLKLKLD